MLICVFWRSHEVAFLERKKCDIVFGPDCGFGVQRTLYVVALEADHLGYPFYELIERLVGTPVIADANLLGIDVRMEHRRQHSAERCPSRVIERQEDFDAVRINRDY